MSKETIAVTEIPENPAPPDWEHIEKAAQEFHEILAEAGLTEEDLLADYEELIRQDKRQRREARS